MIRRTTLAAAAAAAVVLSITPATAPAHEYTLGALKIGHPWARPTPPGAPTAAGYLTITNAGTTPDRFVGVSTAAADKAEIHEMSVTGGVMRMRPVRDGIVLAPGQTVTFMPGGDHVMLVGPKRPFRLGDHVPATLRFERAGAVKVEFYVEASAPTGAEHGGMATH